ncbi:MAG: hypothetical protein IIA61_14480 [Candidatus Marinimicrobia bacterium]|nr:hypothetical protein [Candidatus Neomarinimicrobiota bacterium]
MKRFLWIIGTLLVIIFTGCLSVSVNHYQDGKSLSKGKFDGGVGLALGRTIAFGISRIDSSGYVVDEPSEGPPLPVLNISGRYGLTPKFDLGGELFTSLSSNGFTVYGKYTFSDSLSKWGVSIMPVIGYASGKVTGSGSMTIDGTTISSWENEISHGTFIVELPLLMSYHISRRSAFTFGPRIYYYRLKSKDETKWIELDEVELNEVNRNFFSPAFSFGFQYRGIKPELTFVAVENVTTDEVGWIPYLGIGFFGWEALEKLLGLWF